MARIHVCPQTHLQRVVAACGARRVVSLVSPGVVVARPEGVAREDHLLLTLSDIDQPLDGHVQPQRDHVERFLAFVRTWDRQAPIALHCYAGVSRSPAAAFIAACALSARPEQAIAEELRDASPTATPNRLMIEIADNLLARQGRMNAAIAAIGRGVDCFEGEPFALDLA